MAEAAHNLGDNEFLHVYVEGRKIGGNMKNVVSFSCEDEYYEGEDEYLGQQRVRPWQKYKISTGEFACETSNAGFFQDLQKTLDASYAVGQLPKIVLVNETRNSDGTTSKLEFVDCVVKLKKDSSGKGEKVGYSWSWKGIKVL